MTKEITNKDDLAMDSLIIYSKEEGILFNKTDDKKINVRSIAKLVTSLAFGVLIDKSNGDFNEETLVYDILRDRVDISNKKNIDNLKNIRVKDCLSHTMGYRDIILMSKDIENHQKDKLLDYALNYPLYFKPGVEFLYSNAGYYVLAAVMEEYLDSNLYDFINENIFDKLEIKNPRRDRYGKYLAGATKLYLNAEDMLKLGKLVLNNGYYKDEMIVSPSFIEKMTQKIYKNDKDYRDESYLSDDFYGYSIWTGKDDIMYASGSGGQYVIILKKEGIIIVATNVGSTDKVPVIKSQINEIIKKIKEV